MDVSLDGRTVEVSADGTTVSKEFDYPAVDVSMDDGSVVVSTESTKRNDEAVVGTFRAHIQNMIEGVQDGYTYRLKTVYAHFPMSVKVEGDQVVIQNFIGERAPRRVDIMDGVDVTVNDDEIEVTGPNKESVSQTAARIEQECHKGERDPRKFQDGIYITSKGGGEQ